MSYGSLLNDTCTVQTPTIKGGDIGDPKRTWAAKYSDIPFRIEPLSIAERVIAGRMGGDESHRGYIEALYEDVEAKMRLVLSGTTYEITSVMAMQAASEVHHYTLLLQLLT